MIKQFSVFKYRGGVRPACHSRFRREAVRGHPWIHDIHDIDRVHRAHVAAWGSLGSWAGVLTTTGGRGLVATGLVEFSREADRRWVASTPEWCGAEGEEGLRFSCPRGQSPRRLQIVAPRIVIQDMRGANGARAPRFTHTRSTYGLFRIGVRSLRTA